MQLNYGSFRNWWGILPPDDLDWLYHCNPVDDMKNNQSAFRYNHLHGRKYKVSSHVRQVMEMMFDYDQKLPVTMRMCYGIVYNHD
jgi:hypothetical protein